MIEIITTLIKTKFGFFQVQVEDMIGHAVEFFPFAKLQKDSIPSICRSLVANSLSPW